MMLMRGESKFYVSLLLALIFSMSLLGQDTRTQYPTFLSKSYFGLDIGYIDYRFSNDQLNQGYHTSSIEVPHAAVRITLLGYRFNKYISAELNYMRPISWVRYVDINGAPWNLPVAMNIVTLVGKPSIPLSEHFSLNGELGMALVTRAGFSIDDTKLMEDANYISCSFGAGVTYHLNRHWDLSLDASITPAHGAAKQPATTFLSTGFAYNLQLLSEETVARNSSGGYLFPRNLLQVGYTTNEFGYALNDFFSKGPVPVFWGGDVHVAHGISLHYQRNIFHTRKVFSLDWGSSISYWNSNERGEDFYTISLYPLLRFTVIRAKPLDIYLNYSVAGPTYISKIKIDSLSIGERFTFQDMMGMGAYFGKNRRVNAEIRIAHYSNGNLFPQNEGVKIPMTFNLGWTF